jgi:predicted transposase YdaD
VAVALVAKLGVQAQAQAALVVAATAQTQEQRLLLAELIQAVGAVEQGMALQVKLALLAVQAYLFCLFQLLITQEQLLVALL